MNFLLAFFEGNTFFFGWEVDFILFLQRLSSSFTDTLAKIITMFGEEYIMVAVLGFLYWSLNKGFGEFVGFNLLTVNVLNPMIKNIANRRRPYFDNAEIECKKLVDADADPFDVVAQGYSFPSGHSSGSAAIYSSLPVYKRKKWLIVIAIIIPLLVGLSRSYLGVHYPTDVIAGWALGLFVVFFMYFLRSVIKNKYYIYLVTLAIGMIGIFYCRTNDYFTSLGMLAGFIAGIYFEEKITKFKNTRVWWRMILRVILGGALYIGLNELIKLPVNIVPGGSEWLETASAGNFAFRTIRYAIVTFFVIGVYPISFRLLDKFVKEPELKQKHKEVSAES
ncbi:MAG TPA: phosphatase PAP2 family protein [Clostridia bacterium]|nr:phosphatase PAP2 family protein [Clostridia bacterium]